MGHDKKNAIEDYFNMNDFIFRTLLSAGLEHARDENGEAESFSIWSPDRYLRYHGHLMATISPNRTFVIVYH